VRPAEDKLEELKTEIMLRVDDILRALK